jgi:hypothetical protein
LTGYAVAPDLIAGRIRQNVAGEAAGAAWRPAEGFAGGSPIDPDLDAKARLGITVASLIEICGAVRSVSATG